MNSTATVKTYLLNCASAGALYEDICLNINDLHLVGLISADQRTELQK